MKTVIVSRHAAAIEFIRETLPSFADTPVIESATADAVRNASVAGNLPLHLAALAREVYAVEFAGAPPRGAEYGLDEMRAAGARISRYTVAALPMPATAPVDFTYSDKRLNRGRYPSLYVGRGEDVHRFAGKPIPGVVAVVADRYERAGKWSGSDYTLRRPGDGWHLYTEQDFNAGVTFPDHTLAQIVAVFRRAGCTAPEDAIVAALPEKIVERARAYEAQLNSIG